MSRRDILKLLGYLGIKPKEQCNAELGDWCVWSSFKRNIGGRLTNNRNTTKDDDIYVNLQGKRKIEHEYAKRQKDAPQGKTKESSRGDNRMCVIGTIRCDIITFV